MTLPSPLILAFLVAVTVLMFACLGLYVAIQRQREDERDSDPNSPWDPYA